MGTSLIFQIKHLSILYACRLENLEYIDTGSFIQIITFIYFLTCDCTDTQVDSAKQYIHVDLLELPGTLQPGVGQVG